VSKNFAVSVNPAINKGNTEAIRESGESVETTREALSSREVKI
jgi:hypothetical protein